jgi:hypothetical protein
MKKILLLSFAFLLLFSSIGYSQCMTTKNGLIVGETWTTEGSPYCIDGDILVAGLTIEPGVRIEFLDNYVFEVAGVLAAVGTEKLPIIFTAEVDNENGWGGIYFNFSSPGSEVAHCTVEGSKNSGIRVRSTSPTIRNSVIQDNTATNGGGVNFEGTSLTLEKCIIQSNASILGDGGGIYVGGGELTLRGCAVDDNSTSSGNSRKGGGIYCDGSLVLSQSTITNNDLVSTTFGPENGFGYGGGIFVSGELYMSNCYLGENVASVATQSTIRTSNSYGGGLYITGVMTISNSIFNENIVTGNRNGVRAGGGVYVDASDETSSITNVTFVENEGYGIYSAGSAINVKNTILWENTIDQTFGDLNISYSNVQDAAVSPPDGIINVNPILNSCKQIVSGSLCTDAGNPSTDFNDACIPPSLGEETNDIGAHGGPGGCGWIYCNGDFDKDTDIDGSDLAVFAADFGRINCCEEGLEACEGDFDEDCDVDGSDLAVFASKFGNTSCCPWPSAKVE